MCASVSFVSEWVSERIYAHTFTYTVCDVRFAWQAHATEYLYFHAISQSEIFVVFVWFFGVLFWHFCDSCFGAIPNSGKCCSAFTFIFTLQYFRVFRNVREQHFVRNTIRENMCRCVWCAWKWPGVPPIKSIYYTQFVPNGATKAKRIFDYVQITYERRVTANFFFLLEKHWLLLLVV